jgi:hypothetical protein
MDEDMKRSHGKQPAEKSWIRACAPMVPRFWLHLTAGLIWSSVGGALMIVACYWASETSWPENLAWLLAGFLGGILIYARVFSRIAQRNIQRIEARKDGNCLFGFQPWRSYLLIVAMICLGYALRHSPLPRVVLAAIYAAIGNGLALSSSLYYRRCGDVVD